MALNGLCCADVPLSSYSLTHYVAHGQSHVHASRSCRLCYGRHCVVCEFRNKVIVSGCDFMHFVLLALQGETDGCKFLVPRQWMFWWPHKA